MSKDIRIRKGFNLNLEGEADKILVDINPSKTFALKPDDFFATTPKLLVKEGAESRKGNAFVFRQRKSAYPFCFSGKRRGNCDSAWSKAKNIGSCHYR